MKSRIMAAILVLLTALVAVGEVQATGFNSAEGSLVIRNRGAVVTASKGANLGGLVESYIAAATMNAGDPVALAFNVYLTSTGKSYPFAVTRVASLGSKDIIGVVVPSNLTTSAYTAGLEVDIQTQGKALANVGVNVTVGQVLIQSGTAGLLTASTAATEVSVTQISPTAGVARALETKTGMAVGGSLVKVRLFPK